MARRPATTPKMKLAVLVKFQATVDCAICAEPFLISEIEYDHRKQLSQGGEHSVENLRPLCTFCHSVKTHGTKATTLGSDVHARKKERRIKAKANAAPKPKSKYKKKMNGEVVKR